MAAGSAAARPYQDVRADFEALFPQCENVTPQYSGQRSLALRGVQCVFRLFSPLM